MLSTLIYQFIIFLADVHYPDCLLQISHFKLDWRREGIPDDLSFFGN